MPLTNRVDPFGEIHAVRERGLFTGNRGVIHEPQSRSLLSRRWTTKAWLICECAFQGRRRDVMGKNGRSGGAGWTELFFLDEVTALAAGHRPCFHCRRASARAFAQACAGDGRPPSAPSMDAHLHGQRRASAGSSPVIDADSISRLPDGVMVALGERAFALRRGHLLEWSFSGYGPPRPVGEVGGDRIALLTPRLSVSALHNGYFPVWHDNGAGPADGEKH